jgi:hypothetical protein
VSLKSKPELNKDCSMGYGNGNGEGDMGNKGRDQ